MNRRLAWALRGAIGLSGAWALYVALAFYLQLSWARDLWPWDNGYDGMAPLSFYFLSSIAAAIAAPLLWVAASGTLRAAAAGAFNLTVAFGGISGYMLMTAAADSGNSRLLPAAVLMGFFALSNLVIFAFARRLPTTDPRPLPRIVRGSFALFALTLLWVGSALVSVRPGVMPWEITPEGSVTYGWLFLGAATYFAFAVARPLRENAVGPLLGFLAYDIVLIVPFIHRFSDVPPHLLTSLVVYTAVVVYSGVLAIHFLFLNADTRLRLIHRRGASGQTPGQIME